MNEHSDSHIHLAPIWSMAVGDLGRFLVLLAVGFFAFSFLTSAIATASEKARKLFSLLTAGLLAGYVVFAVQTVGPRFYFGGAFLAAAIAFALFVIAIAATFGKATRPTWVDRAPALAFTAGCLCIFGTIVSLGVLFANDQLHYKFVFDHGDSKTDLKYKIAGIWAGQEGSFLLWATMSAVFGLFGARVSGIYRRWYTATYALFLLALCGILSYESPFNIHPEALDMAKGMPMWASNVGLPVWPQSGAGLAPTLQNYWVVIHPPTIFAGFGSLTLLFAFAVSAILTANPWLWVAIVRPWALVTLAILGIGLCMGGFWAYETLGWGGFWAWDPVENVSFVPWCFVACLVHGIIVQTAKSRWMASNLLFAGLPFLLFVYGTFMTRSGFLEDQSVHSFAQMNRTALWLLIGLLAVMTLGFAWLWLAKGIKLGKAAEAPPEQGIHREGAYRWAAVLLAGLGIATAVGMSVPLIQSILGQSPKRVEEHAYHLILSWFFVPIMLLMAAGPYISWRGMPTRLLLSRLLNLFSVSLGLVGILMFLGKRSPWGGIADAGATIGFPMGLQVPLFPWVVFLTWLCTFTFLVNLWRIVELWKKSKAGVGGFISHIGVAMLLAGLIISRGFEQDAKMLIQEGRPGSGLGYIISYKGRTKPRDDLFNRDNQLLFDVQGPEGNFVASIGQFYVPSDPNAIEPGQTTWPYIEHTLWHDVYIQLSKEAIIAGEPIDLKPGETKDFGDMTITYDRLEMKGTPGQPGTRFLAHLRTTTDRDVDAKSAPYMEIAKDGAPERPFEVLSSAFLVQMVGMDAGTKSVSLQLYYRQPVYPIQIFYKPMTILVWTGTGILTVGGLMTAWYRRRPRASVPASEETLPSNVDNK